MATNTDIVNEFNNFFTNIGKEITNNIPNISSKMINDYLRKKKDHSMFFEPTDEEEIRNVVSQFSLKRSRDHHFMYCMKYIIASIAKLIMHICNLSFSTGIFSDEMKITRVITIFKNINKFKNY